MVKYLSVDINAQRNGSGSFGALSNGRDFGHDEHNWSQSFCGLTGNLLVFFGWLAGCLIDHLGDLSHVPWLPIYFKELFEEVVIDEVYRLMAKGADDSSIGE